MLSQDIKIPIIGANFIKDILWTVPLIEYLLNHVLASIKPKTNRPLVRLHSGIAIDFQLHLFLMRAYKAVRPRGGLELRNKKPFPVVLQDQPSFRNQDS